MGEPTLLMVFLVRTLALHVSLDLTPSLLVVLLRCFCRVDIGRLWASRRWQIKKQLKAQPCTCVRSRAMVFYHHLELDWSKRGRKREALATTWGDAPSASP